ncbi:hypothetical protein XAP6984_300032 [Xanthomonas phaseoli pv. phaseoli]|uniref:Uncharacterized protein n=1 Tax=Xanthomonas campestris pv. phaseoli TaxID=317013 RepID=A0ABY1TSL0_XANCH|nr:hypothetical protein XAP6984_300032 [Xanthomonas phaseoli pv. phaseoli]
MAAATDQCSILRAETQHFHSPVNAPVKADKHYTVHRGDLRAQTVTARSVKLHRYKALSLTPMRLARYVIRRAGVHDNCVLPHRLPRAQACKRMPTTMRME